MTRRSRAARRDEAGFSLVEVLIAVVVLSFGLMAIANLFAMSTSSNVAARHLTAAATQATELMETLKAVPFTGLAEGGQADLLAELDKAAATGQRFAADQPVRASSAANVVNAYEADRDVDGVGTIRIRWRIV